MATQPFYPVYVGGDSQGLTLSDGYVVLRIGGADVISPGTDQAVVVELLDDMRSPAANARHGKYRGEQIDVDPGRVVGGGGIEAHVGVQLLLRLHKFFDLL